MAPTPRKSTAKKVTATVIEHPVEEVALAVQPTKHELVLEGDPEQQLEFAQKAAKALMSVVNQKPKKVMIQGKQYLEFGDWQTLARFFGAAVATEWTKEILRDGKVIGYEAKCIVLRNGITISSAEGMCTIDEKRWGTADEYAIRSMAQTRTGAKALRNAYGWVAELAGYSSTPAEEMDGVINQTKEPFPSRQVTQPPPAPKKNTDSLDDKKRTMALQLHNLGYEMKGMTRADADAAVKKHTGLDPIPGNFDEIITRLDVVIDERRKVGGSELADEFSDYGEGQQ